MTQRQNPDDHRGNDQQPIDLRKEAASASPLNPIESIMHGVRGFGPTDMLSFEESIDRLLHDPNPGRKFYAEGRRGALTNIMAHMARGCDEQTTKAGITALEHALEFDPEPQIRQEILKKAIGIKPATVGFTLINDGIIAALDKDSQSFDPSVALAGVESIISLQNKLQFSGRALADFFEESFEDIYIDALKNDSGLSPVGKVAARCGLVLEEFKNEAYIESVKFIISSGEASGALLEQAIKSTSPEGLDLKSLSNHLIKYLDHSTREIRQAARDSLVGHNRGFVRHFMEISPRSMEGEIAELKRYLQNKL